MDYGLFNFIFIYKKIKNHNAILLKNNKIRRKKHLLYLIINHILFKN